MMRHGEMRSVKVKRDELLAKVKANRASHKDKYTKAVEVYKQEAVESISKLLEDAKAGDIRHSIDLVKPQEYLSEYDQVIEMLTMSVEDVVQLDQNEFAQYVMDKWSWARSFETTTVGYASKFKG